jgi:uncharacterized sporulation protein YeaH/YhbH (DUF444 family)
MSQIIDRRLNGKNKSMVNRQRFIRRFKKVIKQAVEKAIGKRSITNVEKGEKITIPTKDTSEPHFQHAPGGIRNIVHAGNKEFASGDKIKRPPPQGGQGEGNKASNQGEGQDNFAFEISREEFLELFFEDMALPDLVKTQITRTPTHKWVRAGYTISGVPSNISIIRSMRNATSRRMALRAPYQKQLKEAKAAYEELLSKKNQDDAEVVKIQAQIEKLERKIKSVPFIDEIDLRYRNRIKMPEPATQAVMFCIMDVSGSMDEAKKDIAKRFFIMLYLFLKRNYRKIDVVFVRHHTSAKEVDEEEFFYSRETGGTVVSSALELVTKIIEARYPTSNWNIYCAQASDGDNWNADSPVCRDILIKQIMPLVQYYAYVEIMPRYHQSLWEGYSEVKQAFANFAMQKIDSRADIYPVLHDLFKKREQ